MLPAVDQGALALIAGLIGLVGRAAWPLFWTRVAVLRVQLLIAVAFAVHYALIGIITATIVNALGSLQTATALCSREPRAMRYAGYGLIIVLAFASIVTWAGPASLLAAIGQGFIVIARMRKHVVPMFTLLLVGQLLWGIHDIVIGSPAAIAADVVGLLVGAWMLGWRWTHRAVHPHRRRIRGLQRIVECRQRLRSRRALDCGARIGGNATCRLRVPCDGPP